MVEVFEIGTMSARGQIAIPIDIRKLMRLDQGSKLLFFLEDDTLLVKKVSAQTWPQLTRPLRSVRKKMKADEVDMLIHRMRKK